MTPTALEFLWDDGFFVSLAQVVDMRIWQLLGSIPFTADVDRILLQWRYAVVDILLVDGLIAEDIVGCVVTYDRDTQMFDFELDFSTGGGYQFSLVLHPLKT